MYFLDVYPVMARLMHVLEKLFDAFGNSPIPNMIKASQAVVEKRKKELENGSANVRMRCELIILLHVIFMHVYILINCINVPHHCRLY